MDVLYMQVLELWLPSLTPLSPLTTSLSNSRAGRQDWVDYAVESDKPWSLGTLEHQKFISHSRHTLMPVTWLSSKGWVKNICILYKWVVSMCLLLMLLQTILHFPGGEGGNREEEEYGNQIYQGNIYKWPLLIVYVENSCKNGRRLRGRIRFGNQGEGKLTMGEVIRLWLSV